MLCFSEEVSSETRSPPSRPREDKCITQILFENKGTSSDRRDRPRSRGVDLNRLIVRRPTFRTNLRRLGLVVDLTFAAEDHVSTGNEHTGRFGIETDRAAIRVVFLEVAVSLLRRMVVRLHRLHIGGDQTEDGQGGDSSVEEEKGIEGLIGISKGQNTRLSNTIVIATEENLAAGLVEENPIFIQFTEILIERFFAEEPILFPIDQCRRIIRWQALQFLREGRRTNIGEPKDTSR